MSKSKINKKKIVELESIFKENRLYVFRADGVDFKEFRVGVLNIEELEELYEIYYDLSKMVLSEFNWINMIYFFDDEINAAFKGGNAEFERRMHKNLSILSSYISVEFNKLILKASFADKLKRPQEYYFDGRFIEMKDKKSLKEYFVKEHRKSHTQVKNLLDKTGVKGKKPNIEDIINDYLKKDDKLKNYFCLFGCFLSNELSDVTMKDNQNTLSREISLMIDKSFS